MFMIDIVDSPVPKECIKPGYNQKLGKITINEFQEHLDIPLGFWLEKDYYRQWINAIDRLAFKGNSSSLLVTQVFHPEKNEFGYAVECWPLYKDGERVYIHNVYLPYELMPKPWTVDSLYELAGHQDVSSENTSQVSEWQVSIGDIRKFQQVIGKRLEQISQTMT